MMVDYEWKIFVNTQIKPALISMSWAKYYLSDKPLSGKIPVFQNIVACLLKVRIVKPAETAVARERLCKHALC
jgi:hypothetical protein